MINRLCIVDNCKESSEHFYVYYASGMCRVFDYVTAPIREFINRDDVSCEFITHDNGVMEWELTI